MQRANVPDLQMFSVSSRVRPCRRCCSFQGIHHISSDTVPSRSLAVAREGQSGGFIPEKRRMPVKTRSRTMVSLQMTTVRQERKHMKAGQYLNDGGVYTGVAREYARICCWDPQPPVEKVETSRRVPCGVVCVVDLSCLD